MFKKLTNILSGDSNERELKRLRPVVEDINDLEPSFKALSDDELRAKTDEFKQRLEEGEELEDILPEAFAAVREAASRTLGQRHFDVQLLGGMVLHEGKIAEMKTGEGKTLVATLPLYLNALTGDGCHLVTVNDYLARRDAYWMGPIYHALGLKVASIYPSQASDERLPASIYDPTYTNEKDLRWPHFRPITRQEAYQADITYGTNNEFGFDYLRDNIVSDLSQRGQREFNFAIVDEVDNILIDESRTPLIISGQAEEATQKYYTFARMVPRLQAQTDYTVDEKSRAAMLTEAGIGKIENWLGVSNLYDPANYGLVHYVENALKAHVFYKKDHEYVVKDGEVVIVDEFTGRMMFGRRYSEGLHQAIEAKEGLKIQRESITLATITFQNYFRMYEKLAGMTGTAVTEAEEFHKIYKLEVVVIPTNRAMVRKDYNDQIYKTEAGKFRAVVREIEEQHALGRPILVGTVAIETSERLSQMLVKKGIRHNVLNAKEHEKEAYIVAQAGTPGAVTIATNMAGRGVDILLGGNPEALAQDQLRKENISFPDIPPQHWTDAFAMVREGRNPAVRFPCRWAEVVAENHALCAQHRAKVLELGGLHIVGTEHHEARRIDNQLRGRAGRQGDPGSSRFYVSLEDDIMRRFGGDRIAGLMGRLGFDEDTPIEHSLISKAIENTQVRVEGHHFDTRKHLLEYDDVLNKHRESIYEERTKILSGADLKANIRDMIDKGISDAVYAFLRDEFGDEWNLEGFLTAVGAIMPLPAGMNKESVGLLSRGEIEEKLLEHADSLYEQKEQEIGPENMRTVERLVMLRAIDNHWREHLTIMEDMRHGVGLQAYAQKDPLVIYKTQAHGMFQNLQAAIQHDIVHTIFHVGIVKETPAQAKKPEKVGVFKKTGRNDPCPCGSGKKYKKCCGAAAA